MNRILRPAVRLKPIRWHPLKHRAKTQKRKNAHKDPAVFLQHGESQFVIINVTPTVIRSPTAEV